MFLIDGVLNVHIPVRHGVGKRCLQETLKAEPNVQAAVEICISRTFSTSFISRRRLEDMEVHLVVRGDLMNRLCQDAKRRAETEVCHHQLTAFPVTFVRGTRPAGTGLRCQVRTRR